jgi:ABC-type multidrug transport system ATPase subunit
MGPNGSGKSTVSKILGIQLTMSRGEINLLKKI